MEPNEDVHNMYAAEPDEGQQPTGEPQEGQPQDNPESDELTNWDKEKSVKAYRKLQSHNTELDKAIKEAEKARIQAEERAKFYEEQAQSFKQPKLEPQAPPEEPVLPPRPANFNQSDIYDENTPTGQWFILKTEYDYKKDAYDKYWRSNIESERQQIAEMKKQEEEFLKKKNFYIEKFQKEPGVTLQEAMEAFDFLNSEDSIKPANVIDYKRFVNSREQKLKGQRPGEIRSAPTVPSDDEPTTDESKEFIDSVGARGGNIFLTR